MLGLLDEGVKHDNIFTCQKTVEAPPDARLAARPQLKQAIAKRL